MERGRWGYSSHGEQPRKGSAAGTRAEHLKDRKKPGVPGAWRGQNGCLPFSRQRHDVI